VRGARLPRTRDRGTPLAVAGTARGHVTTASGAVEALRRFLAYAAHELRGSIALQRTPAQVALGDPNANHALPTEQPMKPLRRIW
jgi:hypothetical protein